jgi:hypothetical protein
LLETNSAEGALALSTLVTPGATPNTQYTHRLETVPVPRACFLFLTSSPSSSSGGIFVLDQKTAVLQILPMKSDGLALLLQAGRRRPPPTLNQALRGQLEDDLEPERQVYFVLEEAYGATLPVSNVNRQQARRSRRFTPRHGVDRARVKEGDFVWSGLVGVRSGLIDHPDQRKWLILLSFPGWSGWFSEFDLYYVRNSPPAFFALSSILALLALTQISTLTTSTTLTNPYFSTTSLVRVRSGWSEHYGSSQSTGCPSHS